MDELDGVDEDEDDGLEVEPLAAAPFVLPEELGVELDEEDDAPPPAWSFFWSMELDDEELEGEVLDGLDGVVAPADDEDDGEVEDGLDEVVEDPVAARSLPARSHAVSRVAPSAMETAIAIVESLMWPPWLGYSGVQQGLGRAARH